MKAALVLSWGIIVVLLIDIYGPGAWHLIVYGG